MPRLLAENPSERPTNLLELVETLRNVSSVAPEKPGLEEIPQQAAVRNDSDGEPEKPVSQKYPSWNAPTQKKPLRRKSPFTFILAGAAVLIAAVLIAAVVGFFVFSDRTASTSSDKRQPSRAESRVASRRVEPGSTEDFNEVFGVQGIYEGPRK